jgi:orotate phosphoribosyltransferase
VCGPLVGGAFVAQFVAAELGVDFVYAERLASPLAYRLPAPLREAVRGKRAAVVDDVINAGSATRATLGELRACGARPVVVGALLVLGDRAAGLGLALERLEHRPSALWDPADCPLCAAGVVPLEDPYSSPSSSSSGPTSGSPGESDSSSLV